MGLREDAQEIAEKLMKESGRPSMGGSQRTNTNDWPKNYGGWLGPDFITFDDGERPTSSRITASMLEASSKGLPYKLLAIAHTEPDYYKPQSAKGRGIGRYSPVPYADEKKRLMGNQERILNLYGFDTSIVHLGYDTTWQRDRWGLYARPNPKMKGLFDDKYNEVGFDRYGDYADEGRKFSIDWEDAPEEWAGADEPGFKNKRRAGQLQNWRKARNKQFDKLLSKWKRLDKRILGMRDREKDIGESDGYPPKRKDEEEDAILLREIDQYLAGGDNLFGKFGKIPDHQGKNMQTPSSLRESAWQHPGSYNNNMPSGFGRLIDEKGRLIEEKRFGDSWLEYDGKIYLEDSNLYPKPNRDGIRQLRKGLRPYVWPAGVRIYDRASYKERMAAAQRINNLQTIRQSTMMFDTRAPIKPVRRIDGKNFMAADDRLFRRKMQANMLAEDWRLLGFNARVMPRKDGYGVYVRRKS